MKRLVAGVLDVLVILSILAIGFSAAPGVAAAEDKVGPYEGTFQGYAYGDQGTRAPLTLDLTHRDRQVEGKVSIGQGLYVDAGICGAASIPATAQYVEGQTTRWNQNRLEVSPSFDLGGFDLVVDFESSLSASGDIITAEAKVDLPWFCGRDPVLKATLYRE
jgi:hypothetical protein